MDRRKIHFWDIVEDTNYAYTQGTGKCYNLYYLCDRSKRFHIEKATGYWDFVTCKECLKKRRV